MGKTANQIETHIERTRDSLGANIHELEQRVKSVTDWKHHFQNNPMTMLGVAFGGGIVLATMLNGTKRRRYYAPPQPMSGVPDAAIDRQKHKVLETWDNIKGALIGVAATRFKDFVGEVVPGFNEQFQHTQNEKRVERLIEKENM
jgi:hypothetical protein